MAENKRQHVVPQFILEFFADDQGLVHARDPKRESSFCARPINIGVESECYTLWVDDRRNTSCDEVNKVLETWTAPHLKMLNTGSTLSKDQWRAIWIISANLLARSRRTRDVLTDRLRKTAEIVEKMATVLRENPLSQSVSDLFGFTDEGENDTPDLLRRVADIHHPITVALAVEGIAEDLKDKPCELLVAPDEVNFITSDDPAIILERGLSVTGRITPGFLTSPSVEVIVPLTPKIASRWGAEQELSVRHATVDEVSRVNRLSRDSCHRHIFACRDADYPVD